MKQIRRWIAAGIKDGVSLDRLLAVCSVEIGLRKETAEGYVMDILELSPEWILGEDRVIRFVEAAPS